MGNKKTIGIALLAVGVVLLIVSLTADMIGIGSSVAGFGYKQIVGTIAGVISYISNMFMWSAMFGNDDDRNGNIVSLILLAIITPIIAGLIQMAISRSREYLADETGAKYVKNGSHLADALEKIEKATDIVPMRLGSNSTAHLFISNPFRGRNFVSMFMTHPPAQDRVKKLRSMKF